MTELFRKIIVFGGAGFIGTNVCLSALQKGVREIVVFDNLSRKGTCLNLEYLQRHGGGRLIVYRGDVRSRRDVQRLFEMHGDAQAIFHFAAQVAVTTSVQNPQDDFEINLMGTFNILEAMRVLRIQAPLVYSSTNKVYGSMNEVAVEETDRRYSYRDYPEGISETFSLDFHSPYGCSKGGADQYVLDYSRIYGLQTVVFRQSCIYGYHQFGVEDQGWVAWFLIASIFDRGICIYGNGKQVRDVLFIDDLVDAFWRAIIQIEKTCGEAYNVGGGQYNLSLLEFLELVEQTLHKKINFTFDHPRPGDQLIFICDTAKAYRDFGWAPKINIEEGVQRLVAWAVDNKDLFRRAGVI